MEEMETCVPPGFRFHPTEEELVGYYLNRKISSLKLDLHVIMEIDLYRMEPWDIQEKCRMGYEEENEWYFFSHKDRKYPTGSRTNRATAAGFWKATGRDKEVMSKNKVIGMRKTLVFYKGRAPNGRKTDWIIHEYRLHAQPQEEGWVVCRAFKKPTPNHSHRQGFEAFWNRQNYYVEGNDIEVEPTTSYPNHLVNLNQGTRVSDEEDKPMTSHTERVQVDHTPSALTNHDYDIDDFLSWQLPEPASSTTHSSLAIVSQEFDLNAQNQESHLFTCLSEL